MAYLLILENVYSLDNKSTHTIGRFNSRDILVTDFKVSRLHATVKRDGNLWTIIDTGSCNGTYINGQKVKPQELNHLKHSDEIEMGGTKILFLDGIPEHTKAEFGTIAGFKAVSELAEICDSKLVEARSQPSVFCLHQS